MAPKKIPSKQHSGWDFVFIGTHLLMKNTSFALPILLSLVLGSFSCKTDQDNLPAVVDIPVAFRVEMKEKFQPGKRPLEVVLSSLEVLDCSNYAIDYDLEQSSRKILLAIKDYVLSEPCATGFGIATSRIDLGILNSGQFDLDISLKDVIQNSGHLIVHPESYSILLETKDGLIISPNPLSRIPDNTIWGGVFPKTDSLTQLAQNFMSDLQSLADPIHLTPGTYTSFVVNHNYSLDLTDPKEPGEGEVFVYEFTGDRNDLTDLVHDYRTIGGEGLVIILSDVEGYTY